MRIKCRTINLVTDTFSIHHNPNRKSRLNLCKYDVYIPVFLYLLNLWNTEKCLRNTLYMFRRMEDNRTRQLSDSIPRDRQSFSVLVHPERVIFSSGWILHRGCYVWRVPVPGTRHFLGANFLGQRAYIFQGDVAISLGAVKGILLSWNNCCEIKDTIEMCRCVSRFLT